MLIYAYRDPPTSADCRSCATKATQINHAFENPKPSHKATAPAAKDNPYLQQPRMDDAKSDQLFRFGGHSSLQMRCNSMPEPEPPPLPLGPQIDVPARTGRQVARLSTLSNPVGPAWLAALTNVSPRSPKCSPRSSPHKPDRMAPRSPIFPTTARHL